MPPSDQSTSDHRRALRALAHELGNLAYRLTFLTENLKNRIPDPESRDEAIALLQDTTSGLQRMVEDLREVAKNG